MLSLRALTGIATALSSLVAVLANTGIDNDTFASNPLQAALQAAPLWLLPAGTCYPSSAEINGKQNPGNAPDYCNIFKLDHNCPAPQRPAIGSAPHEEVLDVDRPFSGQDYIHGADFPTYYLVRYCPSLNQWRILYDVYFMKDTGHRHDWEYAILSFTQGSDGLYYRNDIIMEQDGYHAHLPWSKIPEAFSDTNIHSNNGPDGDHPKLYFSKWHHSVHQDPQSEFFEFICPPNSASDYRKSDFYYFSADLLEDPQQKLDPSWNYGTADSTPASFESGGNYDMCLRF